MNKTLRAPMYGRDYRRFRTSLGVHLQNTNTNAFLPSPPSRAGDFIPCASSLNIQVVAGGTLRFDLVFRPRRPGEHSFSLPLSLEGIPPDGAKRLRVPVSAVGLKPTLTFASTEVDFGRKVVSRDPCALKQYQGEFVLRNASDKVTVPRGMDVQVGEVVGGTRWQSVTDGCGSSGEEEII